jgi:hypothetical protein
MIETGVLARRLRRVVAGPRDPKPRWRLHRAMFDQASLIVACFYAMTAYFLYYGSRELSNLSDPLESLDLLWPVAWLANVGVHAGGQIIAQVGLAAALLGIVWWRLIVVRIFVSAALLMYAAYSSSHGAINHGWHEWFWISVCFWLLPSRRREVVSASRAGRMQFLTAFSLAPLLILTFYTLSGLYKTQSAVTGLLTSGSGGFSPDAMAITVAWRALQTGADPMWGSFVIEHPFLGWPFYMGLYFAELVSVLVFFRPSLHRIWGVILIMFHFGTLLFMDIIFPHHVLICALLFVMSPFALGQHSWRTQIASVPILGRVARLFLEPKLRTPKHAQSDVATKAQERIADSG